jgi:predicted Rossmann fold nucleotide-binding protein DprA/Smf involved in DNA uptake
MASTAIDSAASTLSNRLKELDGQAKQLADERAQVERALAALGKSGNSVSRRKTTATTSTRRRSHARAPRGQRREQVLAHLASNSPARPVDIAREVGVSVNQVHGLLAKLKSDKLIRKNAKGYSLTTLKKPNS